MYDLPYATHRKLIEPISDSQHIKRILIQRFLNFLKQIQKSSKSVTTMLLNVWVQCEKYDWLKPEKDHVRIWPGRYQPIGKYQHWCHRISSSECWRQMERKEIIDVKHGRMNVDGFSFEELDEICGHLCVAWCLSPSSVLSCGFLGAGPVPRYKYGAVHVQLRKPATMYNH